MGRHRRWRRGWVIAALLLMTACSGSDSRVGTIEEFCEGSTALTQSLQTLAVSLEGGADRGLGAARDELHEIRAPEDLRTDLDLLVDVIDQVLGGLDEADLNDPDELAETQDRLARLEAQSGEIQAAADRIFVAIESCPAAG